MKKILLIILTLSFGINVLAAVPQGCLSLANSQWEGNVHNDFNNTWEHVSLSIQNVVRNRDDYYLMGSLNDHPLFKSICVPNEKIQPQLVTS